MSLKRYGTVKTYVCPILHCTDDTAIALIIPNNSNAVLVCVNYFGIPLGHTSTSTTDVFVPSLGINNYLGSTLNLTSTSPAVSSIAGSICTYHSLLAMGLHHNNVFQRIYNAGLNCLLGINAGSKVSST